MRTPEPGERIEIEVTSQIALRIAVDFTDARAEVVDGKIEVTLPNGSVLVLYGEAVDQFLAGYAEILEEALAPAAGWSEVQRILIPLDPVGPRAGDRDAGRGDGFRGRCRRRALAGNDAATTAIIRSTSRWRRPARVPTTSPAIKTGRSTMRRLPSDDAYSVDEDTALVIGLPGVLANDSDGDGDALSAKLVSGPSHGSLTFNADGSFTYNADADYAGADSFNYKVTDGAGHVTSATVNLTVVAVADAPDLKVADASGNEDAAIALSIEPALSGHRRLRKPVGRDRRHSGRRNAERRHQRFTATSGTTSVDVTGWTLAALRSRRRRQRRRFHAGRDDDQHRSEQWRRGHHQGRPAVTVDAVADAPTLSIADASGDEDTAVALSIDPALTDTDGSETLVAPGRRHSGRRRPERRRQQLHRDGRRHQGRHLRLGPSPPSPITPPANSDADFTLTVTATSTEDENGDTASKSADLTVTVAAVADTPTLDVKDVTGDQDTAIALSIDPALVDADGSETSVGRGLRASRSAPP